jgi:hypothetical protein
MARRRAEDPVKYPLEDLLGLTADLIIAIKWKDGPLKHRNEIAEALDDC